MIATSFDPSQDLIVVRLVIWNHRGAFEHLRVAFDTAAAMTLIRPKFATRLGYSAVGARPTTIRSPVGNEPGYLITVPRIEALGFEADDFRLHVHELPDEYELDGLLGYDFLRRFNVCSLPALGELRVAPVNA